MYYHFLFCHRKHRRRTAVKEQEMYPGSEFVAGGQKVKKGVQTRDIVSAVEVRSCYLYLFLLIQERSTDQTWLTETSGMSRSGVCFGQNICWYEKVIVQCVKYEAVVSSCPVYTSDSA